MEQYDVVIIGGGPGGYVAAIRAAQLGFKAACVEKRGTLGGTCLNVGCIPSKALLESSEKYHEMKHDSRRYGIECSEVSLNLEAMMSRKNTVIADLDKGIEGLFKKNKVKYYKGAGSFASNNEIIIDDGKVKENIAAKNIIIATGSDVLSIPGITIDEERIVSSTGALSLKKVPKSMIVIGGGYIGLEMGSVWQRLGAEVTVVEYLDKIVPAMDVEIGKQLQKSLEKQGMKFKLGHKILSANNDKNAVKLEIENNLSKEKEIVEAEVVLVSVGRKAYTEGLALDKVGIIPDERGRIVVNKSFQTSVTGIYAIGDVIAGPMLAHKAEEEGIAVVEIIAGQAGHVNYDTIPGVVYTWPEVATVGKTEEQVKELGVDYNVGKFPFVANSRAKASGFTEGMVKIIARKDNDEVLGVHIIGPHAGTMIAEAVLAMEYKASSEDIARTCHAHPTLNEAFKEAAMDVLKLSIHK